MEGKPYLGQLYLVNGLCVTVEHDTHAVLEKLAGLRFGHVELGALAQQWPGKVGAETGGQGCVLVGGAVEINSAEEAVSTPRFRKKRR